MGRSASAFQPGGMVQRTPPPESAINDSAARSDPKTIRRMASVWHAASRRLAGPEGAPVRLPRASFGRDGRRFQSESLSRTGRYRKLAAGPAGLHFRLPLPQFGRLLGHIFQADALVAAALGHEAVIERYIGRPAALLANFKAGGGFAGDVESLAVAIRSQKDMIGFAGIDRGGKGRLECDLRAAVG